FFFSSRRRHTRFSRDWSSDVCSSDLNVICLHDLAYLFEMRIQEVLLVMGQAPFGHDRAAARHYPGEPACGKGNVPEQYSGMDGEIGRASCRERVGELAGGGALEEKVE